MNKQFKNINLLAILLLVCSTSFAQIKLLKSVRDNMMDERFKDVSLAKYEIDKVMKHPDTKDLCAAYGWRGVIYSDIAMSADTLIQALNKDNTAAQIAGESMLKFYSFSVDDQEKYDAKVAADIYLAYAIVACYNAGIQASNKPGNFNEVKKYMLIVEKLMNYDKEGKAESNSVSKEKANYNIWRTAYLDSLVDEEIIYLEKLMAFPNYFKPDIYIRMAEIYSSRKQYEKALEYLEKGKAKIPQKSGEFLDMQINIEIDRGNMVNLLKTFNEAIKNNPMSAQYYFSRGVAYHKLKEEEVRKLDSKDKPQYYYSQGLNDYKKAIELDPSYYDATRNEAVLLFDSANYIYKMRISVPASEYEKYDNLSKALYKQALDKFENLRSSGLVKDGELLDLLKDMKTIAIKIGNEELRQKYDNMYRSEKRKLSEKGEG